MTVAECDSDPLVPVTVIVYVPSGVFRTVDTVSVELENGPTDDGRLVVGPCLRSGEIVADRLTVLLNPFKPLTVTLNVVVEPRLTLRDDGVTVSVKSGGDGTITVTVVAC